MKIQLLPNVFKKIGLLFWIVGGIPDFVKGYTEGYKDGSSEVINNPLSISDQAHFYMTTISLVGIIIYALSKEKIEDEYMKKLRLESVTITFVLSVFFVLVGTLIKGIDYSYCADSLVELQLLLFLIIFFFKKRSALD